MQFKNFEVCVTRPYEKEYIPNNCSVISMPDGWISDAMTAELGKVCTSRPIMIAGPTGGGKTTFAASICKFCQKHSPGKKVLLLENRTAIATQQKIIMAKQLKSVWAQINDPSALELITDLTGTNLTVLTYQAFVAQYRNIDLKQYDWVILDECHYFLADSTFNATLDLLFWKIPKLLSHAHRVYLTATPGAVLPDICRAEKNNLALCGLCKRCTCASPGKLLLFSFPNHFDRVQLHYFHEINEIVDLIFSHPTERFLIFTGKREKDLDSTSEMYFGAIKSAGISVSYLDRFSKKSSVWQKLCSEGMFDSTALVCTSVLDCGVSIHDPKLRHIVTEATDKTEFLQMIGRKRLRPGEILDVYIRVPGKNEIIKQLDDVQKKLAIINDSFCAARTKQMDSILFRGWIDESTNRPYAHLLNYLGNGTVYPKLTAYHYLQWRKATLEQLLRDTDSYGDSALPRMAHEWLEQSKGYDSTQWLDFDQKANAKAELQAFLESHLGKIVKNIPDFLRQAFSLVQKIKSFPHDETRELGYRALNNRFKALDLPYRICKNECEDFMVIKTDFPHLEKEAKNR